MQPLHVGNLLTGSGDSKLGGSDTAAAHSGKKWSSGPVRLPSPTYVVAGLFSESTSARLQDSLPVSTVYILLNRIQSTGFGGIVDDKKNKYKCGRTPNVMAALPNIGGALCSTPQFG